MHCRIHQVLMFLSLLILSSQIASQPKVIKLTTLNWEPYIGESLPNHGYVFELVEAAFNKSGYTLEVKFLPWARALLMAKRGEVDALFPEYYSSVRDDEFVFSEPFLGGPVGFYKRKDSNIAFSIDPRTNQRAALRALKEYKFGVVRGYLNTDTFDQAEFLYKEDVVDDLTNLKRLFYNRVQLIFIDEFVADYLLTTKLPEMKDQLEFMPPPIEIKHLYLAFSLKVPNFSSKLEAFNKGLEIVKADGTLQHIYARHGFKEVLWYQRQLESTKSVMPE